MKSSHALNMVLLAIAFAFSCSATPVTPATSPPQAGVRAASLQDHMDALVRRALPGTLGITVIDLQRRTTWRANAGQFFPMMSVFKVPVAAAVLARVERGQLSLNQRVVVKRSDLESGVIRDHFQGEQMRFSIGELLTAAISKSDNTAVDTLLKVIGGPTVVTTFLRTHGIEGMRVDIGEAGFGPVFKNLPAQVQPPVHETAAQELARLRRGYDAYLNDPRNRSTPDAAALFLRKLWNGKLLSPTSTHYLIDLMYAQTTPRRLRAGLPSGVQLADKCGTSYTLENRTAAFNDIGILVWPDGRVVIVAAFLTGSMASPAERQAIFADLAREVASALHP